MIEVFVIMALWAQSRIIDSGVPYYTKEACVKKLEQKFTNGELDRESYYMYGCVPVYKLKEVK